VKTPFGFANWNIIIGFLISWGVWVILEHTAFKWHWIDISDGLIITMIFTITSYLRGYVLAKIYHKNIKNE